jgi:hypothetical protein
MIPGRDISAIIAGTQPIAMHASRHKRDRVGDTREIGKRDLSEHAIIYLFVNASPRGLGRASGARRRWRPGALARQMQGPAGVDGGLKGGRRDRGGVLSGPAGQRPRVSNGPQRGIRRLGRADEALERRALASRPRPRGAGEGHADTGSGARPRDRTRAARKAPCDRSIGRTAGDLVRQLSDVQDLDGL